MGELGTKCMSVRPFLYLSTSVVQFNNTVHKEFMIRVFPPFVTSLKLLSRGVWGLFHIFYPLSSTLIHFHPFPSILIYFHPLASIFIPFIFFQPLHQFSSTFIQFHPCFQLSFTFIYVHPLSSIVINFINFCPLSSASVYFHPLSS